MKGKAYSVDLRERVVARVAAGVRVRSVAALFAVSVSSVVKWSQLYRRTGGVTPGFQGNHIAPRLLPYRDWIKARFEAEPHLTLRGLQAELHERFDVKIDYRAVWNFVHAQKPSFKKKHSAGRTKPPGRRVAPGARVARELDAIIRLYGKPKTIVSDNVLYTEGNAILAARSRRVSAC